MLYYGFSTRVFDFTFEAIFLLSTFPFGCVLGGSQSLYEYQKLNALYYIDANVLKLDFSSMIDFSEHFNKMKRCCVDDMQRICYPRF